MLQWDKYFYNAIILNSMLEFVGASGVSVEATGSLNVIELPKQVEPLIYFWRTNKIPPNTVEIALMLKIKLASMT